MDAPSAIPAQALVVFSVSGRQYALPLAKVERIFRAAEPSPLPKAPEIVIGLLNIQGRIIPVIDLRKRLRLAQREIEPSDHFILAHTSKRPVVMTADSVSGVIEHPSQELVPGRDILSGLDYVEGVIKLKDGLILINDIDRFLSLEEEHSLKKAIGEA